MMTIPAKKGIICPRCDVDVLSGDALHFCPKCLDTFSDKSLKDGTWRNREEILQARVDNLEEIYGIIKEEPLTPLVSRLREDDAYAWSWHCSVAMCAKDEGVDHDVANRAASRFMKMAFGINSKALEERMSNGHN